MNTLRLKQYVGRDGILKLEVPAGVTERTLDVLVVLQPLADDASGARGDLLPADFFARLDRIEADDMVERGEQPPLDIRENIE